jgi:hypothetical protein
VEGEVFGMGAPVLVTFNLYDFPDPLGKLSQNAYRAYVYDIIFTLINIWVPQKMTASTGQLGPGTYCHQFYFPIMKICS